MDHEKNFKIIEFFTGKITPSKMESQRTQFTRERRNSWLSKQPSQYESNHASDVNNKQFLKRINVATALGNAVMPRKLLENQNKTKDHFRSTQPICIESKLLEQHRSHYDKNLEFGMNHKVQSILKKG